MRKITLGLILTSFLLLPVIGLANGVPVAPRLNIMTLLGRIVDWLFAILLIVAAIWLIIAGYYFITAHGDPDRVSKARNMVLWALIGVLVAFAARGLVELVKTIAGEAVM